MLGLDFCVGALLLMMLTLSAIDRKYLLKASAMSYWVLLILPSVFKDSIAAMLAFLRVSKFTILHVSFNFLNGIVIGLSQYNLPASLIALASIL